MNETTGPNLKRLAEYVKTRREHLGLRQDEVGEHGGPSTTTLTKVENATPPAPAPVTLRKLDVGMGWKAGSARQVMFGGYPELDEDSPLGTPGIQGPRTPDSRPAGLRMVRSPLGHRIQSAARLLDAAIDALDGADPQRALGDLDAAVVVIQRTMHEISEKESHERAVDAPAEEPRASGAAREKSRDGVSPSANEAELGLGASIRGVSARLKRGEHGEKGG